MRSLKLIIASNGLAIFLTVVFLLPIVAIFAYVATSPLDDALGRLGLAMRNFWGWSANEFDTLERFLKIGFAIRSVIIAVSVSFLYFGITNWLNIGLARTSARGSIGRQSRITEAIQPWIFVGPTLVLLLLFLLVPALSTLRLSFQEYDGAFSIRNYAFLWDPDSLGYLQFRLASNPILSKSVRPIRKPYNRRIQVGRGW